MRYIHVSVSISPFFPVRTAGSGRLFSLNFEGASCLRKRILNTEESDRSIDRSHEVKVGIHLSSVERTPNHSELGKAGPGKAGECRARPGSMGGGKRWSVLLIDPIGTWKEYGSVFESRYHEPCIILSFA